MTQANLRYGVRETGIGIALAAIGRNGVVAILLGSDAARLSRDIATAFPEAKLVDSDAEVVEVLERIGRFVADPRQPLELKLDLHGTVAERAVWAALAAIPSGETRSYGEIAKSLAGPITAQEVGAACAANVIALAIPCHRVIKADGSISGYRWGVARKRRLLELEAAA